MSRLVVDLSPAEHQYLKQQALINGQTLKKFVKAYLFRIPNAETLEAIENAEKNINTTTYESTDMLFADWEN